MSLAASVWLGSMGSFGRLLFAGAASYASLVILLRVSGKRTLSKLNAFDLVITVALGSTLSSVITSQTLPILQGVAALALLVALQFVVTWTCVRFTWCDRLVKSEPTLLLHDGAPLPRVLRRQRVTRGDLLAAVRRAGGRQLSDAQAVVMETDGSLTAVLSRPATAASS